MTAPLDTSFEARTIDAAIAYKARGWRAISPMPPLNPPAGKPLPPALVLIGSKADGWTRILSIFGPDRYKRASALVSRYNDADDAKPVKIEGVSECP
jgi:hypothetical protein